MLTFYYIKRAFKHYYKTIWNNLIKTISRIQIKGIVILLFKVYHTWFKKFKTEIWQLYKSGSIKCLGRQDTTLQLIFLGKFLRKNNSVDEYYLSVEVEKHILEFYS